MEFEFLVIPGANEALYVMGDARLTEGGMEDTSSAVKEWQGIRDTECVFPLAIVDCPDDHESTAMDKKERCRMADHMPHGVERPHEPL
jgi:hypothetical protein